MELGITIKAGPLLPLNAQYQMEIGELVESNPEQSLIAISLLSLIKAGMLNNIS